MIFEEWWLIIDAAGLARREEGVAMKAAAHDAWNAATKVEREACAKIAETFSANGVKVDPYSWIADAIRARSHH